MGACRTQSRFHFFEIEPFEFEDEARDLRHQGRINDGRRMYRQEGEDESAVPIEAETEGQASPARQTGRERSGEGSRSMAPREGRRDTGRFRPPPQAADPFFDKPYEVPLQVEGATAAPEPVALRPGSRGISPYIKSKRKVAALFKAV